MVDFSEDRADAECIEQEVRRELDEGMRGAARVSEFTVDLPLPLGARPPLTEAQLSDAGTVVRNAAGYLGLPQLPPE